jgi:hypothetical protein
VFADGAAGHPAKKRADDALRIDIGRKDVLSFVLRIAVHLLLLIRLRLDQFCGYARNDSRPDHRILTRAVTII